MAGQRCEAWAVVMRSQLSLPAGNRLTEGMAGSSGGMNSEDESILYESGASSEEGPADYDGGVVGVM